MKKICGMLIIAMSVIFTGCGGNTEAEKYITESKIAMANEEYDKAIKLIKLGIEGEEKSEYIELLKIAESFLKLEEINESLNFKEFDKIVEELNKLELEEIYKEELEKFKTEIAKNKKDFELIVKDIEVINNFKEKGELDKAKEQISSAIKKIEKNEKVKEVLEKEKEDIGKIIIDAKEKIKKLDSVEEINYIGVRGTNEGGYDRLAKLKGKRMLNFKEVGDESPREYMYDLKTGDIYNFNQGDIIHVNTKKVIFDGMKYERELAAKKQEEAERKILETKEASKELFDGLEYVEKNKHGVITEALMLDFSASEFDIFVEYSIMHLQRGDAENGESIRPENVTQEMVEDGRILARGDIFNGYIEYKGSNIWIGKLSNSSEERKCEIKKISKGKYQITIAGETKIFVTRNT